MFKPRYVFPRRHTFLPVVHVEDRVQAERNVRIAQENGAHGAFLINHQIPFTELLPIYVQLKQALPNFWMGMNVLDVPNPAEALALTEKFHTGLWVDNADVSLGAPTPTVEFQMRRLQWNGIYFGGVAFKYQGAVDDPARAAAAAKNYVDVVTTSGDGTGMAPDPQKIKVMKEAIGEHALAIASGITPENVHLYMEYADCFLVATGISDSHTELNPVRVRELSSILSGG